MSRAFDFLRLVKFSHSVFALPFALSGAWLAAGGAPEVRTLAWIVVCAVAARTAAMGFNRLVDRRIDAKNPRTARRELPAGVLSPGAVRFAVALAATVFVAGAFRLNPLCGRLSFPVLFVLLGYSYVKRFSFLAHLVLGLALAIAPLGAWLAVRGDFAGDLRPILLLALGVLTWVAGFDLIYASQDAEFDARSGLHSIPARFGVAHALGLSKLLHGVTLACLAGVGALVPLGFAYWVTVGVAGGLIVWQHRLVRPDDLSRVDMAFFTLNGWVGVSLFLGLALDLFLRAPGAGA